MYFHGLAKQLSMRMLQPQGYPYLTHELASRIGMGAFEYEFGALDGSGNLLAKTYLNLLYVLTIKH
jgi:hypothetical protein